MFTKCHRCKNDSEGKYYCDSCTVILNKKTQNRRLERRKAGLCTDCGGTRDTDFIRCSRCRAKEFNEDNKRNKQKLEEGNCNIFNCKNKRFSKGRFCEIHRQELLTRVKKRDLKLIRDGLCTCCASERYMDCYTNRVIRTKLCQKCYLRISSGRHLGNRDRWKELLDLLERQNFKCPYTGDNIVLAVNDSVDHILPRSLYPDKSKDIDNIRWVTRTINHMKYDLLHDDFCAEIIKIVKHLGADPKIATGPQI
jgi:hypothetical protein